MILRQNGYYLEEPSIIGGHRIKSDEIVIALNSIGKDVGFAEITSDKGHDSFLLNIPDFLNTVKNFLNTSYNKLNEKRI
mgnify:CR=1 FL=1